MKVVLNFEMTLLFLKRDCYLISIIYSIGI